MKLLYTVQKNDTLDSISLRFGLAIQELLDYNKISKNNIIPGVRLVLCKMEGERYVVKPFDTLEKIAKKFNTDVLTIRGNNKLTEVFLGQIIYI